MQDEKKKRKKEKEFECLFINDENTIENAHLKDHLLRDITFKMLLWSLLLVKNIKNHFSLLFLQNFTDNYLFVTILLEKIYPAWVKYTRNFLFLLEWSFFIKQFKIKQKSSFIPQLSLAHVNQLFTWAKINLAQEKFLNQVCFLKTLFILLIQENSHKLQNITS